MIQSLPGWINYLILWHLYFLISQVIYWPCIWAKFFRRDWRHLIYLWFLTAVHAGMYLSKWSYVVDRWRFW